MFLSIDNEATWARKAKLYDLQTVNLALWSAMCTIFSTFMTTDVDLIAIQLLLVAKREEV